MALTHARDDVIIVVVIVRASILKYLVASVEKLEKSRWVSESGGVRAMLVDAVIKVLWFIVDGTALAKIVDDDSNERGVRIIVTTFPISLL